MSDTFSHCVLLAIATLSYNFIFFTSGVTRMIIAVMPEDSGWNSQQDALIFYHVSAERVKLPTHT
jgi:hypothetical protein